MKQILRNFLMIDAPLLIMACQILVEVFVPDEQKPAFHSEGGPHEMMEAFFLIMAFPVALYLCAKVRSPWLKAWTGLAALCCFYVGGEELSWGQHIFHWATPTDWAQYNDQDETNLHNTSTWLDQKPRAVLELGVIVGGLVIPAIRKWWPEKLPQRFKDIYPGNLVVFTASCALLIKILNMLKFGGHHIFWRGSEVMELYLYYFVLLYLVERTMAWSREKLI